MAVVIRMNRENYDFTSARALRQELVIIYRRLKQTQPEDGCWDWELKKQITELDLEMEAAHRAMNGKMTVLADGHPMVHWDNVLSPILPQWANR